MSRSTSNPDLSPSSISNKSMSLSTNSPINDDDHSAFVLKVFRSDQSYKFLPVHKETTAKQVVMLAITEFGIVDPSSFSIEYNPHHFSSYTSSRVEFDPVRCDNLPPLKYKTLHNCISRILKKGTVNDRKRSGRPITTTTLEFQQNVNYCIKMKKGASSRKIDLVLKREQFTSSQTSVYRTAKQLNLKWYKKTKIPKIN
ncbi:unnamed protein product [Rotaria sp. Silwood2]|nr:unnamed protein product [Rotaria sp. Silwood2]